MKKDTAMPSVVEVRSQHYTLSMPYVIYAHAYRVFYEYQEGFSHRTLNGEPFLSMILSVQQHPSAGYSGVISTYFP
jgi:hypothetical protein